MRSIVAIAVLLLALGPLTPVAGRAQAPAAPPQTNAPQQDDKEKTAEKKAGKEPEKPAPAEPDLKVYDEIDVTGRASDMVGVADSASEGVTGHEDLERRPVMRPGELLETVPGVIITQHSGGGKANQYFLRGFNLDHGTDFRTTVDGIPVNMPSHGHGQGYSDINFLIPELVESVRYKKGPYAADEGDFSAAGAAEIEYLSALPQGIVQLTPGELGYGRALVADSVATLGGELLGALELGTSDGPWVHPDDYRKVNGVVRYSHGDDSRGFKLTAMGYDGSWNSTDQIPERAVQEGLISRFGALDPSDGGSSSRYSLAAELRRGTGNRLDHLEVWAVRYDLSLFSNFTYFLDDPENGDQFEQVDDRTITGFQGERRWTSTFAGREAEWGAGLQVRADDIANGLFHTRERERLSTTRRDDIRQLTGGPWAEARVRWSPWLRTVAGLRADGYWADVDSNLPENSGKESDALLSPKLSLLLGPWSKTELYANFGYGFHSNDARGSTIRVDPRTGEAVGRVPPLVRAKSADLGVRTEALPGLHLAATAFVLDLASELIFVGDAGGTEASRPSRRTGVELQSFWRPRSWLSVDADLALSKGRFQDDDPAGNHIPGAIERAVSAGVSVEDLGPFFGSLRLRYFGPRPLIEDDSIRSSSSSLVNARVGYAFRPGLRLALEIFNLLDERSNDIEYFYESRLPGEDEPVEDVHFHPHEPRALRLVAEWRY